MRLCIGLGDAGEVADFAAASARYRAARDADGRGASEFPEGRIFEHHKFIARVSYNGRVWPMGKWVAGMRPLYDCFPVSESVELIAQSIAAPAARASQEGS